MKHRLSEITINLCKIYTSFTKALKYSNTVQVILAKPREENRHILHHRNLYRPIYTGTTVKKDTQCYLHIGFSMVFLSLLVTGFISLLAGITSTTV